MRRYLVTGCAGFIGSHLTETLLADGHEVVGVDCSTTSHSPETSERNLAAAHREAAFAFHDIDLAELSLDPLAARVHGIFHLAVQGDLRATRRLFAAAAAAGTRVAVASSSSVYGAAPAEELPESTEPRPRSPAGLAALACEQAAHADASEGGLDAVILRYFTVYGPRQRPGTELARMVAALRGDSPFAVPEDRSQPRDLTYIGDAVRATIAAMDRAPAGVTLNVGGGARITLAEAMALVEELAGQPVPTAPAPGASDGDGHALADIRRIATQIGWRPRVPMRQGMASQLADDPEHQATARKAGARPRPSTPGRDLPLVSIVVPVFNGGRYLRESLDSIVAQTYPRLEIIVLDDASTDETEQVAGSYGRRISYHRQARTRGQFDNVNDGIALSRGELIAVYHSDDVYRPGIVEREVDYLHRHPEVAAVFCKDLFIDDVGRSFGRLELPDELAGGRPLDYATVVRALLRHKNRFLRCPSSMVRAGVYREVGPYRSDLFAIASDLEMWLRIARRHPIGIVDEHLFSYRSGHGSLSDRYNDHRLESERYFGIMDLELEHIAGSLAGEEELAAFAAYRAEDQLRLTVSNYVGGRPKEARAALAEVSARRIVASSHVQRARLLALMAIMHGLTPLPRLPPAAKMLDRRLFERRRSGTQPTPTTS